MLQRKCACGGAAGMSGQCEEYRQEKRLGPQPKLKVNEPWDIYEQEADRVADQVLTMPVHPGASGAPPRIHRFSGQSNGQIHSAPDSVDEALASPGRPLEPTLCQDMEKRFGYDFSHVRVHSNLAATQSARDVSADAYTVGYHIAFDSDRFAPATHAGRRLIAHELTHVLQQSTGPAKATQIQRKPAPQPAPPTLEESDKSWIKAFGLRKWLKGIISDWRDTQARYAAVTAATFHPTEALLMGILTASQSRLDLGEAQIMTELNGDPALLKEFRDAHNDMISVVVSQFASLTGQFPEDKLTEYKDKVGDVQVKAYIENLLKLPRISTPLRPKEVTVEPTGSATLVINAVDVVVKPDTTTTSFSGRAQTDFEFDTWNFNFRTQGGKVTSFTGPGKPKVTIQTTYGSGVTATSASGYGKGTAAEDIKAGKTTLQFHEGRHGSDFLEFLRTNPFPTFTGTIGMSVKDFQAAMETYKNARTSYKSRMDDFSKQRTDCVGTTIDQFNRSQSKVTKICRVIP